MYVVCTYTNHWWDVIRNILVLKGVKFRRTDDASTCAPLSSIYVPPIGQYLVLHVSIDTQRHDMVVHCTIMCNSDT